MRTRLAVIACMCFVALAVAAATPGAVKGPVFVIAGGGWGHGVGMSQWGAYGQAKAGRTSDQILATYYPGTELADAPAGTARLRVLLAAARKRVTLTSSVPFSLSDAAGSRYDLPAGDLVVDPKLALPLTPGEPPVPLVGPIQVRPGKGAPLEVDGKAYRGELRLAVVGKALQLVNVVSLESYLLGVVPGEMPKGWPAAALEAQAIAARTYAVGNLLKGKAFDLYPDWRSQVYYGLDQEAPATTQAVKATRGKILTYEGRVAQVFYFSSSGGRTQSALDVFGVDLPYLVAVDDPWDEASPLHVWPRRQLTAAALAKAFGLTAAVRDVAIVPGTPGHPAELVLTTATGLAAGFRLSDVRNRLGLRSTAFRLGVLSLDPPRTAVVAGKALRLTGLARDVEGVALERRDPGGIWTAAAKVAPRPDGTFTATLRPTATATYRLAAEGIDGVAVTVKVAESSP